MKKEKKDKEKTTTVYTTTDTPRVMWWGFTKKGRM